MRKARDLRSPKQAYSEFRGGIIPVWRGDSGKPIKVQIRRDYPGDIVFRSQLNPTLHDFQTVQFEREIAPGEKADLDYEIMARMGYNQKQNRVELLSGEAGR